MLLEISLILKAEIEAEWLPVRSKYFIQPKTNKKKQTVGTFVVCLFLILCLSDMFTLYNTAYKWVEIVDEKVCLKLPVYSQVETFMTSHLTSTLISNQLVDHGYLNWFHFWFKMVSFLFKSQWLRLNNNFYFKFMHCVWNKKDNTEQ